MTVSKMSFTARLYRIHTDVKLGKNSANLLLNTDSSGFVKRLLDLTEIDEKMDSQV